MKVVAMILVITFTGASLVAFSDTKNDQQEPPTIKEIMAKLDTNKDGKISQKEAEGPLERDFAKIDVDKDGFITKAELEKAPKPKGGPKGERPAKR